MKKSVKAGIYTFDFEKIGNVVTVSVKSPGGAVVGTAVQSTA